MSLLMQALKKAERAKQAARHDEELAKPSEAFDDLLAPQPPAATTLSLSPLDEASEPPTPDPAPAPASDAAFDAPGLDFAPDPAPPPAAPQPAQATPRVRRAQAGRAPLDPRVMRIALLGTLAAVVLGAFSYIYWDAMYGSGSSKDLPMVPMPGQNAASVTAPAPLVLLAPPAAEVAVTAPPAAAPAPAGIPAPIAAPAPPPAGRVTSAAPPPAGGPRSERFGGGAPPGSPPPQELQAPSGPPPEPQAPSGPPQLAPAPSVPQAAQVSAAAPPEPAPAAAPDSAAIRVARSVTPSQVDPALQSGFQQFNAGNVEGARHSYGEVLARDANNRDALLGMAAIAQKQSQFEQAQLTYQRLLELDPNDADAIAGLSSVRPADPGQTESRLRHALQRTPDAAPVLFTLGNLYAQQRRWAEAQQAYFRAYTAAPGNADYAFNLAVGLDRMNQGKLALTYYQRALALAHNGIGNFNQDAVRTRIAELGGQ